MNWLVFFIGGWLMMGLELGLRDPLALGPTGAAPSFVLIYLVFIALSAPRATALWAGLALGLMLDLSRAMPAADGLTVVWTIGPMAIGGAAGAYAVTIVRSALYQRNPIAAPICVALAVFLAHLVAVSVFTARSWYDPAIEIYSTRELGRAVGSAIYSAIAALVLSLLLHRVMPLISAVALAVRSASVRTSSATTAKPRPARIAPQSCQFP